MKLSFIIYLAFSFSLYCWHIATFVLGVFLADYFSVSDTSLDLKSDIKKAAVCSFLALTPTLSVFYFAPNTKVLIIYLLVLWVSAKLAYLGTNHGVLGIIVGTNLAGLVVFRYIFGIFKLWGILILIFLVLTVLLLKVMKKKKLGKTLTMKDKQNEQKIRIMVKMHPDFHTLCHECKQFNSKFNQCQWKIDRRVVKDIQINGKTYCAYWESING